MATFIYKDLLTKYDNLEHPLVDISVEGKSLLNEKHGIVVTNIVVDLTSGFEASQATFELSNVFFYETSAFDVSNLKSYALLGSVVIISAGYMSTVREVFRGVICRVNFSVGDTGFPFVAVTALDVKGIMMSNHYHKQLSAKDYSGAVKEIFDQSVYQMLKASDGVFKELAITNTPDHKETSGGAGGSGNQETDVTMEMVGESDYEFVVRAAKRFNYEFFCIGGQVLFRKAKSDKTILIELGRETRLKRLDVIYDMTGLVETVEVRGLDVGKATVLSKKLKNSNKFSQGGRAKSLLSGTSYVYVDPTVNSKDEAEARANYLLEDISYRYGTLEIEMYGIPEMIPGRFMVLRDFGKGVENKFYITQVRHRMSDNGEYLTKVTAKANSMAKDS